MPRNSIFNKPAFLLIFFLVSNAIANEPVFLRLAEEPLIRIGLATNVSSVAISTPDTQLVAASADEPNRFLAVSKITVTARAYRPPEIEVFAFEIAGIQTRDEAEQIARDAREATNEAALSIFETATNTWRVRIGEPRATPEEAAEFKALLSEKGFDSAKIVTEKRTQPSSDAIALSQKKTSTALGVLSQTSNANLDRPRVATTDIVRPVIDANLREVIVSGASPNAKYASLKPVLFGSTNDRSVPVSVNGKKYRGNIEVFVNNRGSLTVVNVVRLEDYLRGVVPNELSLPAIEAQKAQAVAARTYAVKNIGQFASQGFDMLPTTRLQVYQGFSSESSMGTTAVNETSGIVA
ncbi:MAG TPA: SpoIID/LytB domain-containing protein, partial [Pyrinomonadaceae bacterium]|nr:SpoIID/LytB domain-containing protein [Pyrinomonadaceae bacterium]